MSVKQAERLRCPDGTAYDQPTGLFIDGQFQPSKDCTVFETINPYTQKEICAVARGKPADVDEAVQAAKAAYQSWRLTSPEQRGKLLARLADLVDENAELLAKIEVSVR